MFTKAERKQSKLRLAFVGPSGSGKTYSSLLLAKGLSTSIALFDTESGSGSLYADLVDYDICQLRPPFTPEAYIEAIKAAEDAGYGTIIIDSLSHAWAGPGGILEFVDRATQSLKNNFAAWREASPKHNSLVDALLQSKSHIIATMRSKTAWEVQKDERTGKTRPVKIGLAPVQRDGLEYEFTSVLDLETERHIASSSKDRTGLFDGRYFVPGTETGEELRLWLEGNSGNDRTDDTENTSEERPFASENDERQEDQGSVLNFPGASTQPRTELLNKIVGLLRELGLAGHLDRYEAYLSRKYAKGLDNLSVEELEYQVANLARCREDASLRAKFEDYLISLAA